MPARDVPRLVLVGVHGHGRQHLDNALRLARRGEAVVAGVCDLQPPDPQLRGLLAGVPWSTSLAEAVRRGEPDVCVISTPIHTHAELTIEAVGAGCDVLLEKPPAPTWPDFQRMRAAVRESGKECQVGFQSLGSAAVPALRRALRDGRLGEPVAIGAAGSWTRDSRYYGRADWAGRRELGGRPVVDGALTNPFAHAVATALAIAGAGNEDALTSIEVELFRANPIEADDTSCLRVRTAAGLAVTVAVTLCAAQETPPWIHLQGSRGSARFYYTADRVDWSLPDRTWTEEYPRADLLTDLLRQRTASPRPADGLLAPLDRTAAFMRVLEAIRLAPEPTAIPDQYVATAVHDGVTRRTIAGIAEEVERAALTGRTFRELGLIWTGQKG
jgi:predicted dehydrogenase